MSTSTASRSQNGRINVHEPGDYPIILGDSFKNETNSKSQSQLLRLRYNWEPRQGFVNQKGNLKKSNGQFQLAYEDTKSGSSTYDYTVAEVSDDSVDNDKRTTQLALVFDPAKSAYVLEQISKSLDFNLTSAHDQSRDEVKKYKKIAAKSLTDSNPQKNGIKPVVPKDSDEEADPTNPYDFRHFLTEAKENAEKAIPLAGSRTPIAGNRTPASGISSPSLPAGRFLSTNTSQFMPTPKSAPLPKKPNPLKSTTTATSKKPLLNKRKAVVPKASAPQPISNEVVSDSSDEDNRDTITVARSPRPQPKDQTHKRHESSTSDNRSPPLIVEDNGSGLVIDMGSPPPEKRPRTMINPADFRSQTHTPTLGLSSNKPPFSRSPDDVEMRDRSEDEDDDEDEQFVYGKVGDDDGDHENNDEDAEMDGDVEEIELGSPRSRRGDERKEEHEEAPLPPTPPAPQEEQDDDDDEMEKLLEQELEAAWDEESEVSEEE